MIRYSVITPGSNCLSEREGLRPRDTFQTKRIAVKILTLQESALLKKGTLFITTLIAGAIPPSAQVLASLLCIIVARAYDVST